jgi:hypothetical protein
MSHAGLSRHYSAAQQPLYSRSKADINFGASTPPVYEVYGLTQAWRETAYQLR